MGDVNILEVARQGITDIAALGQVQTGARDGVVAVVNELCDGLQLASDVVSAAIGTTIADFYDARGGTDAQLRGFFVATATRFSDQSLGTLLHEGKVCGRLHALGDRFKQPLSKEAWSGIPFWQAVAALFTRSSPMSQALHGLLSGEKDYLRQIGWFLREVQVAAEDGAAAPSIASGEKLVALLRQKRTTLQAQAVGLRTAGDACIAQLA